MGPRVNHVQYISGYRLELGFTDGLRKEIDFKDRIIGRGGVFRLLADTEFFRQVRLEPEAGTIVWPNGVDFCPDVLYSLATGQPIQTLQLA
jgi:hypothetical protein